MIRKLKFDNEKMYAISCNNEKRISVSRKLGYKRLVDIYEVGESGTYLVLFYGDKYDNIESAITFEYKHDVIDYVNEVLNNERAN